MQAKKPQSSLFPAALLKEPAVHFLLIAALIITVNEWRKSTMRPEIRITTAEIASTSDKLAQRYGLTPENFTDETAVREAVIEEILYQEAIKSGLTNSPAVKDTLINLMRSQLLPTIADPTTEQLQEYRRQNAENYRFPPRLSFEHVSYRADSGVPPKLLARLQAGEDPGKFGEQVRLANPLPPTYQPQLERLLGEEVVAEIFKLPLGTWQGPFQTQRGIHFIRLIERTAGDDIPFEQVLPTLRENWISEQQERGVMQAIEDLGAGYRIHLPAGMEAAWPP